MTFLYRRLYYFTFILISVLSCAETQIENDIRVVVKGNILDQLNTPVSGALVQVFTDADAPGATNILVGEGLSDESGNFFVTSLFGPNALFYVVITSDNQFSTYRYQTNTESFTPLDLVFDLDTVSLQRLAAFNYTISRETSSDDILNFNINSIDPGCIEVYEEGIFNAVESSCLELTQISRQLNNLSPSILEGVIYAPLQSQVEFTYSINDGDDVTETITLNSPQNAFELNY